VLAGHNFKVVVRVRPFAQREESCKSQQCISVDSRASLTIHKTADVRLTSLDQRPQTSSAHWQQHSFAYDCVFDSQATQDTVYALAVRPVVHSVLEGYNGSIIAYGQTGTGKTYTIEGDLEGEGVCFGGLGCVLGRCG
jgi:kinesin family protein 3/17